MYGFVAQAWASVSVVCNTLITCTISFCLWKMKKRTSIQQTTDILARLMTLTVETGLAGTLCTATTLFLFLLEPTTFLLEVPLFVLSKVYSNSLLAVRSFPVKSGCGRGLTKRSRFSILVFVSWVDAMQQSLLSWRTTLSQSSLFLSRKETALEVLRTPRGPCNPTSSSRYLARRMVHRSRMRNLTGRCNLGQD